MNGLESLAFKTFFFAPKPIAKRGALKFSTNEFCSENPDVVSEDYETIYIKGKKYGHNCTDHLYTLYNTEIGVQ